MKTGKFWQKTFAFLLCLVLTFSCLPGQAFAAQATADGLKYEIADGQVTITGYTGDVAQLEIPSDIMGYPVTVIDGEAFFECSSLQTVHIGSNVRTIGARAFAGASALECFTVAENNANFCTDEYGVLFNADMTVLVAAPGAYAGSYMVPEGVTEIADSAFYGMTELMDIVFPGTLETIGRAAFQGSGLTMVTILENITYIAPWAFAYCGNLSQIYIESIALPEIDSEEELYSSTFCDVTAEVYWQGYDPATSMDYSFGGNLYWNSTDVIGPFGCFCEYPEYELVRTKEATCLEAAVNIFRCAVCGGTYEEIMGEPEGHRGTVVVTPPTETEQGYTTYTCSYCDFVYVYDYTDPVPAEPEETVPEGLTYEIIDGEAVITGYTGTATELVIPNKIEGYPVTVIGLNAFKNCANLTALTLPENLKSIGVYAFYGCKSLTDLVLPEKVETIGAYAFYNCIALTSILIPDSVESVGFYAFAYCSAMTKATLGSGIEQLDEYAFYQCRALTDLTIKNGAEHIGDYAFASCSGLVFLEIPGSIELLGRFAFSDCIALTAVTLEEGMGTVGTDCFSGCTSLAAVTIGAREISNHVFRSCTKLNAVKFLGSAPMMYQATFNTVTATVQYPAGDGTWTDAVKKGCSGKLTWVEYGEAAGIAAPVAGTYQEISYLISNGEVTLTKYAGTATELVIPETIEGYPVTTISQSAFRANTTLVSITIPETVTTIGGYAFYQCSALKSVTIPNSVESVGSYAFSTCHALTDVVIGSGVKRLEDKAFYNCQTLKNITIKYGVGFIGYQTFAYLPCLETIFIPGSVMQIAIEAFLKCTALTEVTLGDGLGSVGNYAFKGNTSLSKITIGDDINVLGNFIFDGCKNIHTFVFLGDSPDVCSSTTNGLIGNAYYPVAEEAWTANAKSYYNSNIKWHPMEEVPVHEHIEENDAAVAATCTQTGLTEGTHCIRCGKAVVAQQMIPALGHKEVIEEGVSATCTATGLTEGKHCGRCGEVFATQEEIPALGHKEVIDEAVEATCTATGLTEGKHCDHCGEVFVAQEEIPALGHKEVIDEAVESTCVTYGKTEGSHCERCGEVLIPQKTLPLGDHTYGPWVITKAPTFKTSGMKEQTCIHCPESCTEVLAPAVGKIEQWNISLTDALQVNFHLLVSETILDTATVKISVADKTITYKVADLVKTEEGLYVASVELAAAQMSDDIVVFVMDKNQVGDYDNYTIRQYADAVLADESLSLYHNMVREMLSYGAAAQRYFDYCADTPADAGITDTGLVEIPETVDQELTVTGSAEGVSFYAATLSYRDRIAVRFYFRFTGDITQYTFTVNGKDCDPGLKNGWYYVDATDIMPEDLDQQITVTVTDGSGNTLSVTYGPMNYIVRMNEKGSETLKALLKALYNYHLAAKELKSA